MTESRSAEPPASRPTGQRRFLWWVIAIVGVVVLYLIGSAVIPRWWAQRVADVVDDRFTVGALYGLFIGMVFTVGPLLAALAVIRWRTERRTWKGWVGWVIVIILLAAPNLMTLGIVLGRGDAAHAGERILDVDAPGFRAWSLVGAVIGALAVALVVYLTRSRRSSRRRASELHDELRTRDQLPE